MSGEPVPRYMSRSINPWLSRKFKESLSVQNEFNGNNMLQHIWQLSLTDEANQEGEVMSVHRLY